MSITSEVLLKKLREGSLSPKEEKELELRIESGEIDLSDIELVNEVNNHLDAIETPSPSLKMDDYFYAELATERRKQQQSLKSTLQHWWEKSTTYSWHWGYSFVLVLLGILVGINWPEKSSENVDELRAEVLEMKEMMMLAMLENQSTTERLRAVNLTQNMDTVSTKVSTALINTLRTDENNNVRMAAIEVLASYTDDPLVRRELVNSIVYQESPLVQLALAELMVAMNEQDAKKAFDQLWLEKETPDEVKDIIQDKMQTLI